MISYGLDLLRSGWSFFFRFPNVHTDRFIPAGIFLGPVFQAGAFALVWGIVTSLHALWRESALAEGHHGTLDTTGFVAFVALSLLTGFFHEDGFADTADGLGVPSYGARADRQERIREAMKDSRLGTYGVSALVILWVCRYAFTLNPSVAGAGNSAGAGLVFVVFASRFAGLAGACFFVPPRAKEGVDRPGIARHILSEIPHAQRWVWLSLLCAGSAGLWIGAVPSHPKGLFITVLFLSWTVSGLWLWFLRRRHGAICGDSIGSSICLTEVILVLLFQYF